MKSTPVDGQGSLAQDQVNQVSSAAQRSTAEGTRRPAPSCRLEHEARHVAKMAIFHF